jgi:hypothetical protein
LASALHGDLDFDAVDAVRFASEGVELGVDVAGTDGVDSYPFFGDFFGEAQGERVDGSFCGGVVDVFVGRADAGGSRGYVDDGATVAAVAGGHAEDGLTGAEERSEDVGGEDAVQAGGVNLVEAGLAFDDAGVVDEGGDGAELARGLIEEADNFLFAADVGLEGDGGASGVADGGDYFFGGGQVAVEVDADVESAGGGALSGGGSDAAAGAGDEENGRIGSGHMAGILAGRYLSMAGCGRGRRGMIAISSGIATEARIKVRPNVTMKIPHGVREFHGMIWCDCSHDRYRAGALRVEAEPRGGAAGTAAVRQDHAGAGDRRS